MSAHVWNVSFKWTLESSTNRTASPCCPQLYVYLSVWDYSRSELCSYLRQKLKMGNLILKQVLSSVWKSVPGAQKFGVAGYNLNARKSPDNSVWVFFCFVFLFHGKEICKYFFVPHKERAIWPVTEPIV